MKFYFYKFLIFLFIWFISLTNFQSYAQNTNDILIINLNNGTTRTFPIKFIHNIQHIDDFISINLNNYSSKINLDKIISLGILTSDNESADVDFIEETLSYPWQIFDISGVLIKEGQGNSPDFSGLHPGKIYVVKTDSNTYKYMPTR